MAGFSPPLTTNPFPSTILGTGAAQTFQLSAPNLPVLDVRILCFVVVAVSVGGSSRVAVAVAVAVNIKAVAHEREPHLMVNE